MQIVTLGIGDARLRSVDSSITIYVKKCAKLTFRQWDLLCSVYTAICRYLRG